MKKFRFMPLTAIGLTFLYVGFKLWRAYPCNNGGNIEFLKDGHYIYFNTSSGVLEGDFKKGDKLSGGTAILGYSSVFAMKIKD